MVFSSPPWEQGTSSGSWGTPSAPQPGLTSEISLPADTSWLCQDFLTVCTLPVGACCHALKLLFWLSPNSPFPALWGWDFTAACGGWQAWSWRDPRVSGFGVDAQHPPVPSCLVAVSGQLRPLLVKLVVTLVAHGICTGEFSWLTGDCILPCTLFRGGMVGWVSQAAKPYVCGSHSITLRSHQHPNLAGYLHAVPAGQPTGVGPALGRCSSPSGGGGCPLRPPAPPVRASPSPPRGSGTRECVSLMRLGLEQLCCWHRERGMERGR